jgi:hypothetical protein
MFTRPHGLDWLVNLRPSLLDDHSWYVPFIEVMTSEKLPWATTPATHAYETAPEAAEFEPLMQAFAREGAPASISVPSVEREQRVSCSVSGEGAPARNIPAARCARAKYIGVRCHVQV